TGESKERGIRAAKLCTACAPISIQVEMRFFFQTEDGKPDGHVTGVQTCALPISGEANWLRTLTSLAIMCTLLAAAVYLNKQRIGHGLHFGGSPTHSSQGKRVNPGKAAKPEPPAYHAQFRWVPAVVVASIILGIAG